MIPRRGHYCCAVKVALLTDCYLPRLGGIEVQMHDLGRHLVAAGHEVHAFTRCLLPPERVTARTDWMFGSQRRLVRRWECETDIPKPGPFPQMSHTAAMKNSSKISTWGLSPTAAALCGANRQPDQDTGPPDEHQNGSGGRCSMGVGQEICRGLWLGWRGTEGRGRTRWRSHVSWRGSHTPSAGWDRLT